MDSVLFCFCLVFCFFGAERAIQPVVYTEWSFEIKPTQLAIEHPRYALIGRSTCLQIEHSMAELLWLFVFFLLLTPFRLDYGFRLSHDSCSHYHVYTWYGCVFDTQKSSCQFRTVFVFLFCLLILSALSLSLQTSLAVGAMMFVFTRFHSNTRSFDCFVSTTHLTVLTVLFLLRPYTDAY